MGGSAVKGVKWEAWRSQEPGSPGRGLGTATVKGGRGTRLGQRGAKRNLQVSVTEDRAVLTQKKCLWSIVQIKKRERDLYTTEQETNFLQLCVCVCYLYREMIHTGLSADVTARGDVTGGQGRDKRGRGHRSLAIVHSRTV